MLASEIIIQLAVKLPQLTSRFTNSISIMSVTRDVVSGGGTGLLITCECSEVHGMETGQAVAITNADTVILQNTLTRTGTVGTLITLTPHDLTKAIAKTIEITDSVDSEFNGVRTGVTIVDRSTITFLMVDSGPTTTTGGLLRKASNFFDDYNLTYNIEKVPSPTSFVVTHPKVDLAGPISESGKQLTAEFGPRISAGVTIDRVIDSYTEQKLNDFWLFVVLGNVNASQSRLIQSDALDNQQKNVNYRQQIIEPFSLYVFIPVEDEIAAIEGRDFVHELFRPILRSILFSKLSTGLHANILNPVQFVGHSFHSYTHSVYVHRFDFQQVADVYEEDTVGHDPDVAFRDIDYSIFLDFGTRINFMQGTPKLDDET